MAKVKICGLTDPDMVRRTAALGADWIGLVFHPTSPRAVTVEAAETLLLGMGRAIPVGLLVDPDDALVSRMAALGMPVLQLHGRETPARVAEIKARTGAEVWKAVGIAAPGDLEALAAYEAADRFLLDARPPSGADRPGGHGIRFDAALLSGWKADRPWLLAGGLTPETVSEAIAATGAPAVDVSSGVERRPGLKDATRIAAFLNAARAA